MKKIKQKTNKSQNTKFNLYLIMNSLILAWAVITNILIIVKYDILPIKYLIPIICIMILIPTILIFLMNKKTIKKKIKIVTSIISIFFILIFALTLFYLNKTFKFLDNLGTDGYTIENYSVIVLNNNIYNDINDIENKQLGYYKNETSHIEEALEQLKEVVETTNIETSNYDDMIEKLYNQELESIIIEESYRDIIEETREKFSEETKVIYQIEVKIETENIAKDVDVKNETFNIYISGIDTYGNISSVSRSDVNIIATVNPTTHQILLTTIPRDYYVQLDGTTGYRDKLTHAGIYGIDKSIKTLENLLDIDINYYVKVNFSSVEKIIEVLGGVEVYSEYTFTGTSGTHFKTGYNYVNGVQALEFARTRKTVSGGDRTRGKNQQALIQAILNKAMSKEIITKYTSILSSLEGTFQTNMPTEKMTEIIKNQINEMSAWNVTSISLDGANGSEYTYSYPSQKLYVMIPYEETIENAKQKIVQVRNGEVLESSYIENTGSVNTPTKITATTNNTETTPTTETIEKTPTTNNTTTQIETPETITTPEINTPEEIPEQVEETEIKEETPTETITSTPEETKETDTEPETIEE